MIVDEFEPREIEISLLQVFADTVRGPINRAGFADYLFQDYSSENEQFERKQPGEILSDMNGVEYQLRKELDKVRRTNLIVEGIVTPTPDGKCQLWKLASNARVIRPGHAYNFQYARYEAWLWGVEEAGVRVWRVNDWAATADAIAMRARQVLRPDHHTLDRYLKQLPSARHDNPQVQCLIDFKGVMIGPEKAVELIKVFGTLWDLLRASPETIAEYVPGVGLGLAKKLLAGVGRPV
jgi:hypothetical protein